MVLIFQLLFFSPHSFTGEILISTVAQVKSHVITSREVKIHSILDQALGTKTSHGNLKDPVEKVIREWLLYFEAASFYNTNIPSELVRKAYQKSKNSLPGNRKWKRLGVTGKELDEMIRRRLQAERLFLFKRKASVLPVSDTEVETEYSQNRIRYGTQTFAQVKEDIRTKKIEQNLQERLDNWYKVLEKKYSVQRFAKYNIVN